MSKKHQQQSQQQPTPGTDTTASIGRIVHFVVGLTTDRRPIVRPAIVTAVHSENACNMQVFTDGPNDAESPHLPNRGVCWKGTVPFGGNDPKTGSWIWPARGGVQPVAFGETAETSDDVDETPSLETLAGEDDEATDETGENPTA